MTVGAGGIWVVNAWSRTLARLDPETLAFIAAVPLGKAPVGVATISDRVWVVAESGWLWSISPT
jgi:streptogramin lyase